MKKFTLYLLITLPATLWLGACSEDALNSESILKENARVENEFDRWLFKNYVIPYNVQVVYRMEDIETNMAYNLVPAEYDKSVQLAKLVLFAGLEAFDEVTGSHDFIHDNFPKVLTFIGSPAVRNNNSEIVGAADGGDKMIFYSVNIFDQQNETLLQDRYIGVVYHEFGHILDARKPRPRDFEEVSGSGYVGDTYDTRYTTRAAALAAGFITPYAASHPAEDFTIIYTEYVTQTQAQWDALLAMAGSTGGPIITAKFDIIQTYMRNEWNFDLDDLRTVALRRKSEATTLDLTTLD
jgi:substrate import-associated zinc metallohydrolase lipoprotein